MRISIIFNFIVLFHIDFASYFHILFIANRVKGIAFYIPLCLVGLYLAIQPTRQSGLFILYMYDEIWKPVVWYEGLYEVSNLGNLKSCRKGIFLSKTITKFGYIRNVLVNSVGYKKNLLLHRLIAQAFIPNPYNYPIVMHIDNDTSNNNVTNLKWGTQSDNIKQMHLEKRHLFSISKEAQSKKRKRKEVGQYTLNGEFIKRWRTISDAGNELGINIGNISSNIKGIKHHSHAGGFIWKYL